MVTRRGSPRRDPLRAGEGDVLVRVVLSKKGRNQRARAFAHTGQDPSRRSGAKKPRGNALADLCARTKEACAGNPGPNDCHLAVRSAQASSTVLQARAHFAPSRLSPAGRRRCPGSRHFAMSASDHASASGAPLSSPPASSVRQRGSDAAAPRPPSALGRTLGQWQGVIDALRDIIAGTIGGIAGRLVEYPFDTVKTKMQAASLGAFG